ncbi:MAG: DUF362 domain-containing protein [archaeon]
MEEIVFIQDDYYEKFDKAFKQLAKDFFNSGETVCVKLHMGESKGFFDPELARMAVHVLLNLGCDPFLFDTTTKYRGNRFTPEGYLKTAEKHGFSTERIGCPIYIDNSFVEQKTEHLNVKIAKRVIDADAVLVLTHFKGHSHSGAGGSIKNIAMGCVHPDTKAEQHEKANPVVDVNICNACKVCEELCPFDAMHVDEKAVVDVKKCFGCGVCINNCPEKAINPVVEMIEILMCEATKAVLDKCKKVLYVNDARNISRFCDCAPDPGPKMANDVGIFMGRDVVAVDKAAIDMTIKENGDVFQEVNHKDALVQVDEGERLGLGKKDYELVRV